MSDRPGSKQPVRIGIAVVVEHGQVLVGQREAGQTFAGLAEFPGGKCEAGESPADCAVRECAEETGLAVRAERVLCCSSGETPQSPLELTFVLCRLVERAADPALLPAPTGTFRWIPLADLKHHRFPPANAGVVEQLLHGEFGDGD